MKEQGQDFMLEENFLPMNIKMEGNLLHSQAYQVSSWVEPLFKKEELFDLLPLDVYQDLNSYTAGIPKILDRYGKYYIPLSLYRSFIIKYPTLPERVEEEKIAEKREKEEKEKHI